MRITTYKTKLNENKLNILVKEKSVNYPHTGLTRPYKVVEMMNNLFDMKNLAEEYLYMLACDTKNNVIGVFELSHGTVNVTIASPREIFIRALLCGCENIILCHNHPSGASFPSKEDEKLTSRIKEVGKIIGISLTDHIIIANDFYSFRENGII